MTRPIEHWIAVAEAHELGERIELSADDYAEFLAFLRENNIPRDTAVWPLMFGREVVRAS